MADILFVNDLRVETILALPTWERAVKQTISLDLEFATDIRRAAQTDDINDTLDYQTVCTRLVEFITASQFHLAEALAEACANIVLEEFKITWVKIRISKFYVVPQAKAVGIVIERSKR